MKRKVHMLTVAAAFGCNLLAFLSLSGQTQTPNAPPAAKEEARPALLDQGLRALGDGLSSVAAFKLRTFLQTGPAPDLHREAALALARALVSLGDAAGALELVNAENPAPTDAQMLFWRAQAQAALGHWQEALHDYQSAFADPAVEAEARFGYAEALAALGQNDPATVAFAKLAGHPRLGKRAKLRRAALALEDGKIAEAIALLDAPIDIGKDISADTHLRAYLLGRLRLLQRQPAKAAQILAAALSQPQGLSEQALMDHYRLWAKACLAQNQPDQAEDALEAFISRYPRHPAMPAMLDWLEQLYVTNPASDDLADLRRWSLDESEPARQALATLALGRGEERSGRTERAKMIFLGFETAFPEHSLRSRAWIELAALQLREGSPAQARHSLSRARSLAAATTAAADPSPSREYELDALDARISLAEGDEAEAAKQFEAIAARAGNAPQAQAAFFNAVLGWLRVGDTARFEAAERDFRSRFPDSPLSKEFALEEGLALALRSSPDDPTSRQRAAANLRRFLRASPSHPRAPEARIALAELAFMRSRPNLAAATRELAASELRLIQNDQSAPDASQNLEAARAEYLAIWLADAAGPSRDEDKAVALAKKFLERYPDSPLAPEARMKLCEIYFRREDYSDAQTQLELLVEKSPSSPLIEQAYYLAGVAASRSMSPTGLDRAVALLEAAARRNGPFKLQARLQQAEAQRRLERGSDALILYEGVLTATAGANLSAADLEARCAAFNGKGETLSIMAAKDAKLYAEAAQTFDALAKLPEASLNWRRQALTKKGRSLEKLGNVEEALAAYYDALNAEPRQNEAPDPEWAWFYRAGDEAARLLEARADWAGAIAIYQKLAAADGLLKSEYENRLTRRRLEHFVWPD